MRERARESERARERGRESESEQARERESEREGERALHQVCVQRHYAVVSKLLSAFLRLGFSLILKTSVHN